MFSRYKTVLCRSVNFFQHALHFISWITSWAPCVPFTTNAELVHRRPGNDHASDWSRSGLRLRTASFVPYDLSQALWFCHFAFADSLLSWLFLTQPVVPLVLDLSIMSLGGRFVFSSFRKAGGVKIAAPVDIIQLVWWVLPELPILLASHSRYFRF